MQCRTGLAAPRPAEPQETALFLTLPVDRNARPQATAPIPRQRSARPSGGVDQLAGARRVMPSLAAIFVAARALPASLRPALVRPARSHSIRRNLNGRGHPVPLNRNDVRN